MNYIRISVEKFPEKIICKICDKNVLPEKVYKPVFCICNNRVKAYYTMLYVVVEARKLGDINIEFPNSIPCTQNCDDNLK